MPKTKDQKKKIVANLKKSLKENENILIIEPKGIDPNESAQIKIKLNKIGSNFHVVKNSLFKIALKEQKLEIDEEILTGQNAIVFANKKGPEAAKIIKEFIKETKKCKFKAGILKNEYINSQKVNELAELPTREVLLSQLVGTMNAPINGFVNVLSGNTKNLLTVLNAIKNKK